MENYGETFEKISEKTGIAVSTLIYIRKGKTTPHSRTIYKLNKYLSTFE